MWHIILTVLVIPVLMWILSSLFRPAEDERVGNRPRTNPRPGGTPPGRRPRSASDIDNFLEEINRRRREVAERQRGTPPEKVVPAVRPRVPPRRTPSPSSREAVPFRSARGPVPEERAAVVEVVVGDSVPSAKPVLRVEPAVVPVAPPAGSRPPIAIGAPATIAARGVSPAMAQLAPFLRSPEKFRTAILLQEVLAPPRCRRFGLPGRGARA